MEVDGLALFTKLLTIAKNCSLEDVLLYRPSKPSTTILNHRCNRRNPYNFRAYFSKKLSLL